MTEYLFRGDKYDLDQEKRMMKRKKKELNQLQKMHKTMIEDYKKLVKSAGYQIIIEKKSTGYKQEFQHGSSNSIVHMD